MELHGKYTVFAEGARGHLGKQLLAKYALSEGKDPQSWAIGVKELWEVAPEKAKPGLVVHTAGWPMDRSAFGGGFLYHLEGNKVTLGFVVGLDYANPCLLYTSDAADERSSVDLGGRRIIKKKKSSTRDTENEMYTDSESTN